jgi:hypothetical protein
MLYPVVDTCCEWENAYLGAFLGCGVTEEDDEPPPSSSEVELWGTLPV